MIAGSEVVCKTTGGLVSHGKKATITFEFTPTSLDLVESFWRFTIPSLGLNVPLLVVGQTKEPRVIIDRSQVSFMSSSLFREYQYISFTFLLITFIALNFSVFIL